MTLLEPSRFREGLILAEKYYSTPCDNSLVRLESFLDGFLSCGTRWTADIMSPITVKENLPFSEFLSFTPRLLCSEELPLSLASKMFAFLYDLAWYSIAARKYLQENVCIQDSLAMCVFQLFRKEDRAVLLQGLKLYQVITYDCSLSWSSITPELIMCLVNEVCRSSTSAPTVEELLPCCLAVVRNLCAGLPATIQFIKKMDSQLLYDKLLFFLVHSNTSVVICSLFLNVVLSDAAKEKVLCTKNLPQTFQCILNVIIRGDKLMHMSRFFAIDLFLYLIKQPSVSAWLLSCKFLSESLKKVATLFVLLEKSREHMLKVYDFFLALCSNIAFRGVACRSMYLAGPVEQQTLVTPLLAVLQCAKASSSDNVLPSVPLKAMQLLGFVLGNLLTGEERIQHYVAADSLVQLVEDGLKITLETGHCLIVDKCLRVHEALRLVRLLCHDELLRSDLLEVINCVLCSHISEFQMLSNPIAAYAAVENGNLKRGEKNAIPHWSMSGLKILVELLLFLREQMPYSEPHAQLYHKILLDKRFRPFLAFGIICEDREIIEHCLTVTGDLMATDPDQAKWLSEYVSTVLKEDAFASRRAASPRRSVKGQEEWVQPRFYHSTASDPAAIDELIKSFKDGNLKSRDVRLSKVIDVYERKIAGLEMNNKQIQAVLRANKKALEQGDRLLLNNYDFRNEAENEASRLRSLLHESELQAEQTSAKWTVAQKEVAELSARTSELSSALKEAEATVESYKELEINYQLKITNLEKALETSRQDMESEKEFHSVLKKHYDQLKSKFEINSNKLMSAEEDLNRLKRSLKEKDVELQSYATARDDLIAVNKQKDEDIACLEKNVETLHENLQAFEREKKALQKKGADQESELNKKSAYINELEKKLQKMEENIEKYNQITQMIHQLTGNGSS